MRRIIAAIVFLAITAGIGMNIGLDPEDGARITSSQEYRDERDAHMARIARQAAR